MRKTELTKAVQQTEELKALKPFMQAAIDIKDELQNFDINDNDSLAIADQKLKTAKEIIKKVDKKRKTITKPLDDKKKVIMNFQKKIIAPVDEGIKDISDRAILFREEFERQRREKEKEAQKKIQEREKYEKAIDDLEEKALDAIADCKTLDDLRKVYLDYINNPKNPSESKYNIAYGNNYIKENLLEELKSSKKRVSDYGKSKKKAIEEGAERDDKEEKEKIRKAKEQEMLEKESSEEVEAIKESSQTPTMKVRKTIEFEVKDIEKVPTKYIVKQINKPAMKEFLKDNREDLLKKIEEGKGAELINGVELSIKTSHIS